ncbi:MAG: phosphatidate cytidylyltransferase [Candidatus Omnitrophica bacterium]|nr:phosphatidate cytidylyltransferase [Candidatus Omnitrophota bacterium]
MSAFSTLSQRVITGLVLIGATAAILFFSTPFYFSVEVTLFVALGLLEFFNLMREGNVPVYRFFGVSMGIVVPVLVYMELGMAESGEILFIVLGCLFLFVLQFFRKDNSQALIGISLTLFGILYVSWFLSFLIKIRFLEGGAWWAAYLIAVTKAADIGAYFVGTAAGRHSLIPHISPKKSVEGTFAGLGASVLVSWALGPYLPIRFGAGHLAVVGLLIGAVGQIGDLSESLMKRFCDTKDSGRLLPGMGGVLDAADSILFTAPIFYFHLRIFA